MASSTREDTAARWIGRVPRAPLRARGASLDLDRVRIMGILNVTPDSFSDGGRYIDPERAVSRGIALVDAGADIVDVGGMSTRPGADDVPDDEEIRRTAPVVAALRAARPDAWISIDTFKRPVAEAALDAGAHVINDVRGLQHDPTLAELAAERRAAMVLMHSSATPKTMQRHTSYERFPGAIVDFLRRAAERARGAGVPGASLVVDPGIGFGKTWPQNVELLRSLHAFAEIDAPLLVGASRKAFLGWIAGRERADDRDAASHAAAVLAVAGGAHILRVHDVGGARDAIRVAEAVLFDDAPPVPEPAGAR